MGWLSGWLYRQQVTVAHSAGAGTGYQVDVARTMAQLNSHANNDFSDVRFTASDGTTLLSYYMKTVVNGSNFDALVKVTDDLSSVDGTIYMYYGNATATTASSAVNTYDYYDDASTDKRSNYTAKQLYNGHTIALGWGGGFYGAVAAVSDEYFWQIAGLSANGNYEVSIDFKSLYDPHTNNIQWGVGARYSASGIYILKEVQAGIASTKQLEFDTEANPPNTTEVQIGTPTTVTAYKNASTVYTFKGRIYGTNLYSLAASGETCSTTDSSYTSGTFGPLAYIVAGNNISFTNVIIRHYTSPEPAPSVYGSEQEGVPSTAPGVPSVPGALSLSTPANGTVIP